MYQITTLSEKSKDINVTVCTHLWFSDRYLTQTHTHTHIYMSAQVHLYITCLPCIMLHSSNVELDACPEIQRDSFKTHFEGKCDFKFQYSLYLS